MKKLGKLSINPEKVIKNEELVNLRGGNYTIGDYKCCWDNDPSNCSICTASADSNSCAAGSHAVAC